MTRSERDPRWRRRVIVASDRTDWGRQATEACIELHAEPELVDWARARDIRGPLGAILADASTDTRRTEAAFRSWVRHAWQPCTVVWLPPVRGATELRSSLEAMGFEIARPYEVSTAADQAWKGALQRRLERDAWLVSRFARALDAADEPLLLRILEIPVLSRDPPSTVAEWRRKAGVYGRREFVRLFRGNARPSPKPTLDRVRLAAGMLRVGQIRTGVRAVWAARSGFASGDSLGRRVKELTGRTALELMELPLLESVELLVGEHTNLEI